MKMFFMCACILLISASATFADTGTITFDDLSPTTTGTWGYYGMVPTNYSVFQWNNFNFYRATNALCGYYAGMVSSSNVAYNNDGREATITNATPFNLLSAYLTAAFLDNMHVSVVGYNAGKQVYSTNYAVSATAPTLEYFNCFGVTKVVFDSIGGTPHPGYSGIACNFVMDNLTFSTTPAVTMTVTANNGSASANPTSGAAGSTTTLTATQAMGYVFSSWTVTAAGGGSISSTTANPAIFTFGSGNASVTANFVAQKTGDAAGNFLSKKNVKPNEAVAEPVDTGNGSHFMNLSLLRVHGAQDLEFAIDYNSIAHSNDLLGPGWSHNFEARLQPLTNGSIQVNWNAKKANTFFPLPANTNVFTCGDVPVVYDTLALNTNGSYSLKEPSQRHFEFDSQGRLQIIVNPHGQPVQLIYPSTTSYPTQIVEVISGKALNLNYNTSNLLSQITDGLGRKVSFAYDASNHLTQFVKSLGTVFQTNCFAYDAMGHILTETNALGIGIFTDTYDSQGRIIIQDDAVSGNGLTYFYYDESQANRIITTVVDRTGVTNIYVHDQNYLLLSITDALGHTTSYGNDTNGNNTSITNALGHVQTFAYDSSGNLLSTTDAAGQTTTAQFDSRNNLIATTNAAGSVATFTYDASNNPTSFTDFLTNQVTLAYDTNSLLTQTTSPRGGKNTFVYNAGLARRITDAATNATGMAYDAIGRVMAITNASGYVATNAYDLNDNLIAAADGLGNVWRFTYDYFGRKLSQTDPLNATTWFYYDGNGNLTNRVDALGNKTFYAYDGEDRLIKIIDANNHTNRLAYDAAGRLTSTADALNHTNSFQYDAVGNLLATVDALGVTSQITSYDPRNLPIITQNALGQQSKMSYDNLQRLTQMVDALNRTNRLNYDAVGRLTAGIDPLSLVSRQNFDGDGNSTNLVNPRNAQTLFQYDLASRLTNTLTAAGRKTSYKYDGRNFVTNILQPSGTLTALAYDAAGRLTNLLDSVGTDIYAYDGKGRLLTITENSKSVTNKYDALDRLTNYIDSAGNSIKYAYDSVGNLTNLTYPDGKSVGYVYDAANRLSTVTDWGGRKTTYGYDANGRVTSITNANGTVTSRTYDAAGRLTLQKDTTATASLIYQVNYNYDAAGQIIAETNQPATAAYLPVTVGMKYDADNALTNYASQAVTNDANGNMTYGPLTNSTFFTYIYDARNRLKSAGGFTNAYDPAGNRVAITNGANVTRFVVNPHAALSQVLMRIKGGMTNYYVYGLGLLYEVTPAGGTNKMLTYHYDYRGSTVAITDTNGAVTDQISYSPYGSITSRTGTNDTPFLFTGRFGVMTDGSGLLNLRARYYNPLFGRFTTRDIFLGNLFRSSSLNPYAYSFNSPVGYIDPSGRWAGADDLSVMAIGGIWGGIGGGGGEIFDELASGKNLSTIDWRNVGAGAIGGAIGGAVSAEVTLHGGAIVAPGIGGLVSGATTESLKEAFHGEKLNGGKIWKESWHSGVESEATFGLEKGLGALGSYLPKALAPAAKVFVDITSGDPTVVEHVVDLVTGYAVHLPIAKLVWHE